MLKIIAHALAALSLIAFAARAEDKPDDRKKPGPQEMEAATQIQVFLDRANFGPGKIDGRSGEFTRKALALYRETHGLPQLPEPAADEDGRQPAPALDDMDLSKADPVFTEYTVTDADAEAVGELASSTAEKARQKWLPYATLAEAVAERFHCDLDFFKELNPEKADKLKAGDRVKVPNVEPFALRTFADLEAKRKADEAEKDKPGKPGEKAGAAEPAEPKVSISISKETNQLRVMEKDKVLAAFPVTIGSAATNTPDGDWKVTAVAKLPNFRWDEKMLNQGERSDDFHLLPPGPNNPVGIVWIALDRDGIGIHGTNSPDTIGRASSHGCIRLANWDAEKVTKMVSKGVAVRIE